MVDVFDGNIGVLDTVKPAAPKPIKILSAGVFHRAEKIGGRGALEHPAARVLFEGVIELLAAEHAFAQDVEREGGFGVGVVAGALEGVGAGHNWHFVWGLQVTEQTTHSRRHDTRGIVGLPFLFSEKLKERVKALIHPHPLALVGVNNHREPIVAHFMDDHGDESVLGAL